MGGGEPATLRKEARGRTTERDTRRQARGTRCARMPDGGCRLCVSLSGGSQRRGGVAASRLSLKKTTARVERARTSVSARPTPETHARHGPTNSDAGDTRPARRAALSRALSLVPTLVVAVSAVARGALSSSRDRPNDGQHETNERASATGPRGARIHLDAEDGLLCVVFFSQSEATKRGRQPASARSGLYSDGRRSEGGAVELGGEASLHRRAPTMTHAMEHARGSGRSAHVRGSAPRERRRRCSKRRRRRGEGRGRRYAMAVCPRL